METVEQSPAREASLEALIETELLKVESLHPGGLELTEELAELCGVRRGSDVLDLACGTGESACFLAERRGARVVGLDGSPRMIRRAEQKARARGLQVEFREADAHHLPLPDAAFDVAICECTASWWETGDEDHHQRGGHRRSHARLLAAQSRS